MTTQTGAAPARPQARINLSAEARALLRCPVCHAGLEQHGAELRCLGAACGATFPIVGGVPVLINEGNSLFTIASFLAPPKPGRASAGRRLIERVYALLPEVEAAHTRRNYEGFAQALLARTARPRVLVVGGGVVGRGMEPLMEHPGIELVESDVYFGPRTRLICDAHDVPFADQAFDGVVVQAVLEHVLDPHRCVAEIHRVLRPDGLVYAETPFITQVHGAPFDFTRFTFLGHRRLFRFFEELNSGVAGGPGIALAWSYEYFLLSLTDSRKAQKILRHVARLTSYPLVYCDRFLLTKRGALDGAWGYYFTGAKSDRPLDDHELIRLYRGAQV